jgi:VanZ family protein
MTLMRVWWALAVVLVLAAMYVCLMPMPPIPKGFDLGDKAWHILGHTGLAVYFTGLVERRGWWKIFVFLLAFGISVEFAQHHMNMGRQGDWRDAVGNAVGDLLGLLLGWLGLSRWTQWAARMSGRREVS